MKSDRLRQVSLEEMIDKHIGEVGSEKRDAFEEELRLDIRRLCGQFCFAGLQIVGR